MSKMSFLVNISKLSDKDSVNIEFTEKYFIPAEYYLAEESLDVVFKGELSLSNDIFTLRGECSTIANMNCDFCIKEVKIPFNFAVEEVFAAYSEDEEAEINLFTGNQIDIYPSILTNILLNIPVKVICKEDCKGLCQYCGADLNETSCKCEKPVNPLFANLSNFFD